MSGECLDPETLALWADDELSGADRAAAERHVADCARCQATLAALVRTAPVLEARRPWWQTLKAAWLAPVAAAAAALAIWIAVPETPPPPSPQRPKQAAENAPATPAAPAASPPAASAPVPSPPAAVPRRDEKPVAREPERKGLVPAAPPPVAFRALAPATADAGARTALQSNVIASDIVSPAPASRWRIVAGRIERSTDGGGTWQEQATGVTSALTAGAAPSPSICWVVGQDGVVLLTTDGRTWRRLSFPATPALVAVRATDERTATVTDANGQTYSTTDGGVTWTQP